MSAMGIVDQAPSSKRRDHSQQMKELSDEAAEVMRLHQVGEIDADEAARRLDELKNRHRTFLDRLVG